MIKLQRKLVFSGLSGVMLSFCYVAGYSLDNYDTLDLTEGSFYVKWLVGSVLASLIVFFFFRLVEYVNSRLNADVGSHGEGQKSPFHIPYYVSMLLLFLCWVPAWLSIFPGAFNYDAFAEWEQVVLGNITSHHPVIHVVWLGGLVEGFFALTGDYNVGIAVYTALQMLALAGVFALILRSMEAIGLPAFFRIFAHLFFAFSPVVQLYSISATKDTLFAAAQLVFFMYVLFFYCQREHFFASKRHLCGFAVAAFFTMILRNNGLYIVLLTLVLMSISCIRSRKLYGKKCVAVLFGILLLYGCYTGPIYNALDVTSGGVEEMLSVPIQQLARVHKYEYDSLSQEDLTLLYKVISKEALDSYRPTVSDFAKSGFNQEAFEEDKIAFVKLWIKWGIEHPLSYVNSFLINTVDFWYPNAVIDGYRDAYGKSSFFDYQVDKPGTEIVLLEGAHNFYEKISHDKEAQSAPFAFLLLSPGWYVLIAMVVFLYLWCYKKYRFLVPMSILIFTLLTVLLGPIALVRYVLIFYYVFPVLLAILFADGYFILGEKREV